MKTLGRNFLSVLSGNCLEKIRDEVKHAVFQATLRGCDYIQTSLIFEGSQSGIYNFYIT